MPQIENEFLSTFVHELLNTFNGISSISNMLKESEQLDRDEIEDSAIDLEELSDRANHVISKLRAIVNTSRTLSSPMRQIDELCREFSPKKGQLPSTLKVNLSKLDASSSLPSELFRVLYESLLYVLFHGSDDAFLLKQTIKVTSPNRETCQLQLSPSHCDYLAPLLDLNAIDPRLVSSSCFGFELKLISYLCQTYNIKLEVSKTFAITLSFDF